MRYAVILFIACLFVTPTSAVTITCVSEGNGVVRIDYDAAAENMLPRAFALDVTVDGGATIESVYDYKVGDSTAASRGFGIFPASMIVDEKGLVSDWGRPDMDGSQSAGVLPGVGGSGVTLGTASRYSGSENAPLTRGSLCRIRIDTHGASGVNVKVAPNAFGGGVVLEDASQAQFTGIGCTLGAVTPPAPPQTPASITYPATSSTGAYTVSWPASTGATSYQLERSANGGSTWTGVYSGTALSYAETVANGSYRYRVRAGNAAGFSSWRTGSTDCVVSTSTPPSLPPTPASITYPATSSTGKYTVSWAASAGATSYRLERSADAGNNWIVAYSGSAVSYSETVSDGTYRYRVQASNSAGSSLWRTSSVNCVVSTSTQPPATKTVGNTTVFSTSAWVATRRAAPYTMSETGQLQSITIYHQGGSGRMILAVYGDSSGRPGARLGMTDSTTVNGSAGWQTVALQSPVSVSSGQRIWLAWVFQNRVVLRATSGSPGRAESNVSWSGGMPGTFGSASVANYIYSIYATYSTGTVPPPPVSYTLSVSATNGSVTRTPSKSSYTAGETVTLQATANSGYTFTGWSGAVTGTANPATVVMDGNKSVTATFAPIGGGTTKTVGNTSVLNIVANSANRRAAPYTMPEAGQLQSVSIYHQGGSGQMILAVYADNSGRPGTRLGATNATAVKGAAGWQTVALQSPVSVSPGQRVWLAWLFQRSTGLRAAAGTPGRAEARASWSDGMPGSFGSSSVANYIYSVYATYAPENPTNDRDDD